MALVVKNLPASAGARGDPGLTPGSDPWTRKILWNRKWQPNTPVFLPGEFHGQRSLVGYSLWGHKESDTTEHTHTHTHTHIRRFISLSYDYSIFIFESYV